MKSIARHWVLAAAASLGVIVPALGDIVYLTQARMVTARVTIPQTFTAPDFGPFNMTAQAEDFTASGSASQSSTLDPTGITASGVVAAGGLNAFTASARSTMDITFAVTTDTPFTLQGSWGVLYAPVQLVRLRENDTVLFEVSSMPNMPLYAPFSAGGTFRPGFTYRFEFDVLASRNSSNRNPWVSYSLGLAIPAPPASAAWIAFGAIAALRRARRGLIGAGRAL